MRLAFLDMPDDRVDLITVARHDPEVELVLVAHHDPDALSLRIAEVLQIPHSTEPLDLLALKPDQVALPYLDSPSAQILARAGISERIFTTLDDVARMLRLRRGGEPALARAPRAIWAEGAREGSRLDQIREALALSEDRQRLFREVLALAVEQTGAESGSIMVLDESETELRIAFADGLSPDVVRTTRQRVGEGVAGRVVQERRGLVINERLSDPSRPEGRERSRIAAAMSAPLLFSGRVFGVINVSSDRPGARFSEEDLARLAGIADDISGILERVVRASRRDLDAVEFRARRELEDLFERAEAEPDGRLRAGARLLASILEAESAQLHLHDARSGRFRCIASGGDGAPAGESRLASGTIARVHERGESFFLTARLATPTEAERAEPLPNLVLVPLRGETPRGVLVLESVRRTAGDLEEFTRRVGRIAEHLARLLERQAAGRASTKQGAMMGALADAAARLMMAHDPETLALEANAAVRALFAGCLGATRLAGSGGDLLLRTAYAGPEEDRERLLDLEAGLARHAMESGQEQHSVGLPAAERRDLASGLRVRGYVVVPVRCGEETAGSIGIVRPVEPGGPAEANGFDELDLQALRKLALYLSLAMEALRRRERRVERALADPETGLLTGAGLEHRIEDEVKRADRYREPFLLTLCTVPGYDRLRRRRGEPWSEEFIREFAAALRRNVREVDAVAWMGGGQFAVLSPATQKDHGVLLTRLRSLLPRLESTRQLPPADELDLVGRQVAYPDDVATPGELLALLRSPA